MNIFDFEKLDIFDAIVKFLVWGVSLVLVAVFLKGKLSNVFVDLAENQEAVEEASTFLYELQQAEDFDAENVVYRTICNIAKEKGAVLVTPSIVKSSLTEEESLLVREIVDGVEPTGESESDILDRMDDRAYLVEFYGMENAEVLFGVVNAHLSEWGTK